MNQAEAARRAMAEWLADEHELGSKPECLEQTQEFHLRRSALLYLSLQTNPESSRLAVRRRGWL